MHKLIHLTCKKYGVHFFEKLQIPPQSKFDSDFRMSDTIEQERDSEWGPTLVHCIFTILFEDMKPKVGTKMTRINFQSF